MLPELTSGRLSVRARALILAGLLGAAGLLAWSADTSLGFGPDQIAYNLMAQELLEDWQQGRPLRTELGSPVKQSFAVLHAVGQRLLGDPSASYRLILFVSALAYLASMYLLLAHVLEDRRVAAVVAILSIVQRYTLGTSFWGMGEFQSVLPRVVVLPVIPIAWLLFERHVRSKKVLLAFLPLGLAFVLHLSAVYFYAVLMLTYGLYAVWKRFRIPFWNLILIPVFLIFALIALPSLFWSSALERLPVLALVVPLLGIGLVLLHCGTAARRWTGAASVVYLGLSVFLLVQGSHLKSAFTRGAAEMEVLASAAKAADPDEGAGARGPGAGLPEKPAPVPSVVTRVQGNGPVAAEMPKAGSASTGGREQGRLPPTPIAPSSEVPVPKEAAPADTGPPDPNAPKQPKAPVREEAAPADQPPTDLELLNEAIYARFGWALFPISLASLAFALFNCGLPGALALYEFVHRWRRGPKEREVLVGLLALSVLIVGLGATGALQLYSRLTGRPDIVLELFRALRFIYLPIYIYLGLFLGRMWGSWSEQSSARRFALAALVVALAAPPRQALAAMPDGVKLFARSVAERSGSLEPGDPSQRKYLYMLLATDAEREQAKRRLRDFLELCEWVRRSTPEDAVFMTTDYAFLHEAKRDIRISYAQGAGSARSFARVSGYRGWHEAYQMISGAFASGSAEAIKSVAGLYDVDYIVVEGENPGLSADRVYSNPSYSLYLAKPRE